ncbi:MAG: hypothetical protein WC624_03360, partial [Candidatus Margulisiibacteriota bacterium]
MTLRHQDLWISRPWKKGRAVLRSCGLAVFFIACLILPAHADANVIDKAQEAVKDYAIKHNVDWEDGTIKVTIKGGDKFFEQYSSNDNVKFIVPEDYEVTKITPNMILPIAAFLNSREVGRITALVRLEVYRDVLVAGRKIGKKETIDERDVDLKTKDVSFYPVP